MTRPARALALLPLFALAIFASNTAAASRNGPGAILSSGDNIDLVNPVNGNTREVVRNRGTEPAFVPGGGRFVYIRDGGGAAAGHGVSFTEYWDFIKSLKSPPAAPGRRLFDWKQFFVREVDVSPSGRLVFAASPGPGPKRDL